MKAISILFALSLMFGCSSDLKHNQAKEQANSERKLIFMGTLLKVENSPLKQSRKNWIVTFSVEKVISGEFAGKKFSFRIHSPSKSGLEKDEKYKVEAELTEDGYKVDQYQWMK
jgi:hypothetical protein